MAFIQNCMRPNTAPMLLREGGNYCCRGAICPDQPCYFLPPQVPTLPPPPPTLDGTDKCLFIPTDNYRYRFHVQSCFLQPAWICSDFKQNFVYWIKFIYHWNVNITSPLKRCWNTAAQHSLMAALLPAYALALHRPLLLATGQHSQEHFLLWLERYVSCGFLRSFQHN